MVCEENDEEIKQSQQLPSDDCPTLFEMIIYRLLFGVGACALGFALLSVFMNVDGQYHGIGLLKTVYKSFDDVFEHADKGQQVAYVLLALSHLLVIGFGLVGISSFCKKKNAEKSSLMVIVASVMGIIACGAGDWNDTAEFFALAGGIVAYIAVMCGRGDDYEDDREHALVQQLHSEESLERLEGFTCRLLYGVGACALGFVLVCVLVNLGGRYHGVGLMKAILKGGFKYMEGDDQVACVILALSHLLVIVFGLVGVISFCKNKNAKASSVIVVIAGIVGVVVCGINGYDDTAELFALVGGVVACIAASKIKICEEGEVVTAKSKGIAASLGFCFGPYGIMDFYAGRIGLGIAKLILSCTILGFPVSIIWHAVDMFRVARGTYVDGRGMPLQGSTTMAMVAAIANLVLYLSFFIVPFLFQ